MQEWRRETVAEYGLLNLLEEFGALEEVDVLKEFSVLEGEVKAWNLWREIEFNVEVDLSGVDFSGANFSGVNLSSINLSNANLSGADLSSANLTDANLSGADLSGINLNRADLTGATLSGANLSGADLNRADFYNSDLSGADLSDTNLSQASFANANLSGANLDDANLDDADLSDANLSEIDLSGEKLNNMGFSIGNLASIKLRGVNLSRIDLSWIDFNEVNFREIDLSLIDFRGVNLSGIDFNKAEELKNLDLKFLDLSDADLHDANLSGVNLNGVNFSNANLSAVDFTEAQVLATNFTGAIMTGACLEDWNINSETNLHDAICEYVYLKRNQQERRPSSGVFKPGEFTALLQKALTTVDLIFADGIDWQAFFQAFQELRSQYDDLSIQAIEKKSGGAFVVRLEVPPEADKAAIESYAKELYEMRLQLQEQRYRAELQAKDGQISLYQEQLEFHRQSNTNLMEIVKAMAEKENQPTYQTTIHAQTIAATHTGSGDITNFTQNINSNIDDITKLITSLRDTAQTFPEAQRGEALEHLGDVEEGIRQPDKVKPHRIKAALAALLTIAGMVAATTDFSNNVLEIGDKLGIELVQTQPNQQLPPSK
ncbi:pentapeptide repeat-containing protein [Cyanobacteria bacterium FACHB-63]|nr:pentapeptide repeat-containing protein [Cyanobacteria bacterium FACHB-63]